MPVALYTRVSTDGQATDNQLLELKRWAERAGHEIVAIYGDNGISGAKGREYRKNFDAMLKAAVRREFDMVAAWSVDRLGRSLKDPCVSSKSSTVPASISFFISRLWTPPHPVDAHYSKCSACSRNSSEP